MILHPVSPVRYINRLPDTLNEIGQYRDRAGWYVFAIDYRCNEAGHERVRPDEELPGLNFMWHLCSRALDHGGLHIAWRNHQIGNAPALMWATGQEYGTMYRE